MDQSDFFFSLENVAAQELEKGILIKSLSLGKNQLRHMVFEPETMIPNHRHPEEVVTMILEGEMEMKIGQETRRIKSGDVFQIPPDTDHSGRTFGNQVVAVSYSLINIFNAKMDDWFTAFKFSSSILIALGGIFFGVYCFRISYFPDGITIGSVLIYLFGFSIGYGIVLLLLLFLSSFLLNSMNYIGLKKSKMPIVNRLNLLSQLTLTLPDWIGINSPLFIGGSLFFVLILAVVISSQPLRTSLSVLLVPCFIFTMGVWSFFKISEKKMSSHSSKAKIVFILMMLLSPISFFAFGGKLFDAGARFSGLRIEKANIIFGQNTADQISIIALKNNIDVNLECASKCMISGVKVLFTGVGDRSLIEIDSGKKKMILTLPNKHLSIVKIM